MPQRLSRGPSLPYDVIAGATPGSGGWLVVSAKINGPTLAVEAPRLMPGLRAIVDERPAFAIVAINAPLGLHDTSRPGGRECDRQARALLGRRGVTLHSAPSRAGLLAADRPEESGLDAVTALLRPRYLELAAEIAPYLQRVVYEARPELSFFQMNDEQPLSWPKHTAEGRAERRRLLEARGAGIALVLEGSHTPREEIHLLDASACLWTARRIASRAAIRLPASPQWDDEGLRMEIVR